MCYNQADCIYLIYIVADELMAVCSNEKQIQTCKCRFNHNDW